MKFEPNLKKTAHDGHVGYLVIAVRFQYDNVYRHETFTAAMAAFTISVTPLSKF